MKTQINITGQIAGNNKLYSKLLAVGNRVESYGSGMSYSYRISFETKRAAKQALWLAFKSLCAEYPEMRGRFGGIRYSSGSALFYDASQAVISEIK